MRLLHFADLHLGIENYGTLDTRTGLSTRVEDFLKAFDHVIDYALENRVDAVLFAGDAFKNRDPNPTIQREFARRIQRLAAANMPAVLLIGNHDLPSITARATAIEIYETLEIPGIQVGRRPDLLWVETASGPLQVVTLPWLARSLFLRNESLRKLDPDEFRRQVAEIMANTIKELAEKLDRSIPAVLLGHVSVEGARLGSEQSIMLGEELVLGPEELQADAFDYVALGHIHQHQSVGSRPPIVYSGSIERIDFGEEREDKGFVVVDLDQDQTGKRTVNWSFHPLPARPFFTLRIAANSEDPIDDVREEITRQASKIDGAIVRAIVSVPAEREDLLRLDDVRRLLQEAGAAYIARVVRDVDLQSRPRVDIRDDEALDPDRMLDRWLETREMSDGQRKKIQELGKSLIRQARDAG